MRAGRRGFEAGQRVEAAGRRTAGVGDDLGIGGFLSAGAINKSAREGVGDISPFTTQGPGAALQKQQALSGALGPAAQAAAFQEFEESPGQAFLREQGLRLSGTQSAVTGTGGGERLRELTKFSQGLALQDLSEQFNRLGSVASGEEFVTERQQRAATDTAGLRLEGATSAVDAFQRGGEGRLQGSIAGIEGARGGLAGSALELEGIGLGVRGAEGRLRGTEADIEAQIGRGDFEVAGAAGRRQGIGGLVESFGSLLS